MRHADFKLSLCASFEAYAAVETENVRNPNAFDFDLLPNLVAHRAALQLDWPVALVFQVFKDSAGANRSDGELFKEAFVCFE
jgi:hypothetical protein